MCASFSISKFHDPEPEKEVGNVFKTLNSGLLLNLDSKAAI
jgi:hypothetical protein